MPLIAAGCSPSPSHPPKYQIVVTRDQVLKLDSESGQSWALQCPQGTICFWREIETAQTHRTPPAP
ncbi:MAG: hypothetical protein DME60_11750 [Verrucomicrobia bacterium]|nr:MAG: hypothetical protein DME60_11750 [Verrucomicrobiota bacterium]